MPRHKTNIVKADTPEEVMEWIAASAGSVNKQAPQQESVGSSRLLDALVESRDKAVETLRRLKMQQAGVELAINREAAKIEMANEMIEVASASNGGDQAAAPEAERGQNQKGN